MSTPSKYAMDAGLVMVARYAAGSVYGESKLTAADIAAIIQKHAIDPAIADKDKAIKELCEGLQSLADYVDYWVCGERAALNVEAARALLAKHQPAP